MKGSLRLRLLFSASFILIAFFGAAGVALENAFKKGAEQGMRERLQVHIYALLAAANLDSSAHLNLPSSLPEARFSHPGSGLYAAVFDANGVIVWQSKSAIGIEIEPLLGLQAGQVEFLNADREQATLYYPVVWENERGGEIKFLFAVAEDTEVVIRQVTGFRTTLWWWLGGIGCLLIIVQLGVQQWSLLPLRSIAKELEAIETGKKHRLGEKYPLELQGIAVNMNALLESERAHLERYRNSLSNLAHSLKTPLAILRGCCNDESVSPQLYRTMNDQLQRMGDLVEYQLQRAAARGQQNLAESIAIVPVINKIVTALDKVYADKQVRTTISANGDEHFYCEEGDLFEIAGNLIDNAYKWCKSKVFVTLRMELEENRRTPSLHLSIEDDGPGIPDEKVDQVLKRGIRVDQQIPGHGIGLSVVHELVQLSGGRLSATKSMHGGLRWEVSLPSIV